jgi:hypothetical protein
MLAYSGYLNYIDSEIDEDFSKVFASTSFATFGDDNIIAYKPAYEAIFSQTVLEKSIPEHLGMSYTNEAKNDENLNARAITQVSFLKRSFRHEKGQWYCPLDLSVIKETLNWKKKDLSSSDMKLRIEAVLAEAAQHGKEVFTLISGKIVPAVYSTYNYVPDNSSFEKALRSNVTLSE